MLPRPPLEIDGSSMESDFEIDSDGSLWKIADHALIGDAVELCLATIAAPLPPALRDKGPLNGLRIRIPGEIGQGTIDFMMASPSLYMMRINATYHDDHVMSVTGDRLVKIRVLLSGKLSYGSPETVIDGAGAYLEAYPGGTASSYTMSGGRTTRLLILHCEPGMFEEMVGGQSAALPEPLRHLFQVSSGPPVISPTPLGPDLLRAANDLFHAVVLYPPILRLSYVEAKGREIGCLILRDLSVPRDVAASHSNLSVRDVSRVYEGRDVLIEQYRAPPTIPQLSRLIGLNQTKFKLAFKLVFGMTIGDFTLKCRMERATELLMTSSMTISEIAYEIGYDHPANMTHAFRRYHGCAPREMRRAAGLRGAEVIESATDSRSGPSPTTAAVSAA
jgi:AraC-like DNA-binding protein